MKHLTLNEITELKELAVKAQRFDLAASLRDIEKQMPDYKHPKYKLKEIVDSYIGNRKFKRNVVREIRADGKPIELSFFMDAFGYTPK